MSLPTMYRKPRGTLGAILPQAPIKNLVFEGGGPKGLVYLGAVKVLEEKGMIATVRNVGGAPAGAMTALAVGLGFTADETREIVERQAVGDLTDVSEQADLFLPAKVLDGLYNLYGTTDVAGRGVFRGEKLHAWIRDLIHRRVSEAGPHLTDDPAAQAFHESLMAKQGAISFAELARLGTLAPGLNIRRLAFTGTNYTEKRLEIFSEIETPDMPVALAVRISASLPWFFKSVRYNGQEYIDGGCLENFPIWIFDRPAYRAGDRRKVLRGEFDQNLATLGFKVDSIEEMRRILWEGARDDTRGPLRKLRDGLQTWVQDHGAGIDVSGAARATEAAVYGKYAQRTVQIPDLDYSTFNFDLSDADKAKLRQSGQDATSEWLALYYEGAGIEIEIFGMSELADYLSPEDFRATCEAYPDFLDPDAKGAPVMAEDPTPFDPNSDIFNGISVLSTNDWVEMTTFFDTAVHVNPTSETKMRADLGLTGADEFRPEFATAVAFIPLTHQPRYLPS